MLVIVIAMNAASLGQLPDQFRQNVQQGNAVGRTERVVHIVGVGQGRPGCLCAVCDGLLALHVRFVGEDSGNRPSDVFAQRRSVLLMGHFKETIHRRGIEYVHVGFAVEPWTFRKSST